MGPFGNNPALNKLAAQAPKPTIVKRTVVATPSATNRASPNPPQSSTKPTTEKLKTANGHVTHSTAHLQSFKKTSNVQRDRIKHIKASQVRRVSPATPPPPHFTDSDDDDDTEQPIKRRKTEHRGSLDKTRVIRDYRAFQEEQPALDMVHAADIANIGTVEKPNDKYTPYFTALRGDEDEAPTIELQYPNAFQKERYQLVRPKDHTDFTPVEEMAANMKIMAEHYLDPCQAEKITDEATGIIHALKNAAKKGALKRVGAQTEFSNIVAEYNQMIASLRSDGSLAKAVDDMEQIPPSLIRHILFGQIYARSVSPQVKLLREYENGTDNVYGELLPGFLSRIFKETKLKSNQTFLDLGSGVGNCVLQAALEIGCESWGCEMMANPCKLAELQVREFKARCRLWGLKPGSVHLVQDNFLTNKEIDDVLKRADVVLINNQAFTPKLNNDLTLKFLDLKEGCQIVSLKSFVPSDHKIKTTNYNMPINLLEVTEKDRWSNEVSWSDEHGKWYLQRKDSRKLDDFMKRHGLR